MPDYIHRKTVLDTIRRNSMLRVQDIYDAVESLPVVNVGNGKWIPHPEQKNVYGGKQIECSYCGEKYLVMNPEEEIYCRHCGSKNLSDGDDATKPYDFLYEEGGVNDG